MIERSNITGLVLAGGQGSRMGGRDKGLVDFCGKPLALHVFQRLQPQVGPIAFSANRNLATYQAMGGEVWSDAPSEEAYAGPLAGFLSGLSRCHTDYLATAPCDTPGLPLDLVQRLAEALARTGAPLASIVTPAAEGRTDRQPVFCLMHRRLQPSLAAFLASGKRRVGEWTSGVGAIDVLFSDPTPFRNANTPDDLARIEGR